MEGTLLHKIIPGQRLKVAAYARVSNDKAELETSIEEQIDYYTEEAILNPNWDFIGVYYDDGISGTTISERHGFQKMLKLARNGDIDVILVKSVSRFARNVVNLLEVVRELRSIGVEIFFESQKMSSLDVKCDQMITMYAEFAEAEAISMSKNVKWRKDKDMAEGKYYIPVNQMLGYRYDEKGNLKIVETEANIIRNIFDLYVQDTGTSKIAQSLKEQQIPNKRGTSWTPSTIRNILRNEKYVGDCLLQKSYSEDPLTHKQVRNYGERDQYYIQNGHPAIIDRDIWNIVQKKLDEACVKYKIVKNRKIDRFPTPYAGFAVCPYCGKNYEHKINHYNGKPSNRFLMCSTNKSTKICEGENYPVEELNKIMASLIGTLKENESRLKEILIREFTASSLASIEGNIKGINDKIIDLENKFRDAVKSEDEFTRFMSYAYKTEILKLTKQRNKYLHQLADRKDPKEATKEILEALRWLHTDPSQIEYSGFRKLFKKCIIVSKKRIYFVIGNENITEYYKTPFLYFTGTHTYKVRQTEFKTSYGIYINK